MIPTTQRHTTHGGYNAGGLARVGGEQACDLRDLITHLVSVQACCLWVTSQGLTELRTGAGAGEVPTFYYSLAHLISETVKNGLRGVFMATTGVRCKENLKLQVKLWILFHLKCLHNSCYQMCLQSLQSVTMHSLALFHETWSNRMSEYVGDSDISVWTVNMFIRDSNVFR